MDNLRETADAFVEMAHRIVWATVSTVDRRGRPRSRVLHPYWERDGDGVVGWVATGPTPLKVAHLGRSPFVSVGYWAQNHDHCIAECGASLHTDDETRVRVWETFKRLPPPVGYDPATIPPWAGGPTSPAFAALRLDPWRLRVFPGTMLTARQGEVLTWQLEE